MRQIKKVLIQLGSHKHFFVKDLDDDFHTPAGVIAKKDLQKVGIVESDKGKKFVVLDPIYSDLYKGLKRGPQIIHQKDIGLILSKTGVNKDSVCLDAGGGSGSLCLSLANVAKKVYVYEINPEHYDVIARNMKLFGIENVELKQGNVYEGISEKELDLVTLDLPEPWQATKECEKALKVGGHLVVYLPNLHQVMKFIDSTKGTAIMVDEVLELLQRKWKITERIMRPEFEMLGHTGFLVFCRRF